MRRHRLVHILRKCAGAALWLLAGLPTCFAAPDSKEAAGWQDLLAGGTLDAWVDERGQPVQRGWVIEDGVLHRTAGSSSLCTKKEYGDFELEFEWKATRGSNSGVKYRLHKVSATRMIGPEYQVVDEAVHRDGKNPQTSAASLYQVKEPAPDKVLKPVGEFNQSRIVARGTKVEHWLNGKKVVEIDTTSDDWRERLAKSKFRSYKGWAEWFGQKPGPIMIQSHTAEVFFRNVRVREVMPTEPK